MEPLIIYLLKANVIISILFLFYLFVLKNDKSFWQNRFYLLSSLLLSLLLPLLPTFSFSHLDTIQRQITTANPLNDLYTTIGNSQVVNTHVSTPVYTNANNIHPAIEQGFVFPSLMQTLVGIYLLVSLVLLIRLAIKLLKISILIKKTDKQLIAGIYYCSFDGTAPFSFFNYLVINKQLFNDRELQQIIAHEKVHIRQLHSVDLLAAELVHAILWVNPLMVYLKRCIKLNHEYIADAEVINSGIDKKDYQLSILHSSLKLNTYQLTNLYSSSKIKLRIKMMNLKERTNATAYKYAFVLLLVAVSYLLTKPLIVRAIQKRTNTRSLNFSNKNTAMLNTDIVQNPGPLQKKASEKNVTVYAAPLKAFEGLYKGPDKDIFILLTEVNNVLVVKELWDGHEFSLKQKSELEFALGDGSPLKFTKDKDGNVMQFLAFGQEAWLKVNSLKKIVLNTQQLKALEGIYQCELNKAACVQIIATQNTLIAKELWDGKEFTMSAESDVSFSALDDYFNLFKFTKDSNGTTTKFTGTNDYDWNKVESYSPPAEIKLPAEDLKKFEGYYELTINGSILHVIANGSTLVVTTLWNNKQYAFSTSKQYEFTPTSPLAFFTKHNPFFSLQFIDDNAGDITQLLAFGRSDVWNKLNNYHPPVEINLTAQELKKFEGKYKSTDGKGELLQITATGSGLVVKQLYDERQFDLAATSQLTFFAKEQPQFSILFMSDNSGSIYQLLAFGRDVWDKVN